MNPDDIVESHGADALRVYEMFMGPLDGAIAWSTRGLDGIRKWLDRVWRLLVESDKISDTNDGTLDFIYNQTVQKVTYDIDNFGMNTAIAQMMTFVNEAYKSETLYREHALGFIKMLAVFAPHVGEELYEKLTGEQGISYVEWPTFDESKLVKEETEIVVQINGKIRAKFMAPTGSDEATLKASAYDQAQVQKYLEGMTVVKEIVIKNKIVNIVVKPS